MDLQEKRTLFPNATPQSLDNFDNKHTYIKEGVTLQNDDDLNKAMSSLMAEYVKDTEGGNGGTRKKTQEGMLGKLTGTSMNMNLLQGDLLQYGRYDLDKNPIQPFTERMISTSTGGGKSDGVVSYKEGLTNDDGSRRLTVTTARQAQEKARNYSTLKRN